jgi:hypothetical protein
LERRKRWICIAAQFNNKKSGHKLILCSAKNKTRDGGFFPAAWQRFMTVCMHQTGTRDRRGRGGTQCPLLGGKGNKKWQLRRKATGLSFDAEELLLEIGGADVSFLLSLRIRLLKRTYSSSIGI